jgi:molybdopterin molybdotransferase
MLAVGRLDKVMIEFDKAYSLIQSFANPISEEHVGLNESSGRVLAENILADMDMPPFNRSAMDGYACRKSDIDLPLKIIDEIPAGKKPAKIINEGTCARIMTGAEIPEGADCVVKVEEVRTLSEDHVEFDADGHVNNIRFAGEDLKKGEVLIPKGKLLNKQHIGLMAMVGCTNPLVYKQPKVGILCTGSELVDPDTTPGVSGIRNSNGAQLQAQLRSLNVVGDNYGIVKDDKASIRQVIESNIEKIDILLLSGGISMGDYDFVPDVLKEIGFDIKLHKIKVRPGKPILFAVRGDTFVFGLPGNPVSAFVQFEIIIKPFLLKMMGIESEMDKIKMVMGEAFSLKVLSLRYFVPVKFVDGLVFPLEYHGSGHLASYVEADGILEIPEQTSLIKKDDLVYVRPI